MKSKILALFSLSILFLSCSSDNSSGNDTGITSTSFPLSTGNYWTYDVYNQATTNTPESFGRDSLYVPNDTIIGGITYKKMKTLNLASGFYSGTLANNGVRIDGSKVRVSGSLAFNAGLPTSLAFSVSDFIILKEGASVGEELSSTSGSFEQTFDTYPLTFTYTLKSVSDGSLSSYSSNGTSYTDITKTKVILNLKITTTIAGIPITVMPSQDVLVSNQFYSKNIGLVYNKTVINYNLSQLPSQVQLPIPQSGSQTQEEFLDTYQIN
jgi:hypothetical protein